MQYYFGLEYIMWKQSILAMSQFSHHDHYPNSLSTTYYTSLGTRPQSVLKHRW